MSLKSVNVAMPTPFNNQNKVEWQSIGGLMSYYRKNGLRSILICGSTGEQHSLKIHEKLQIIDYIDQINNKDLETIFGVSSVFYDETLELVERVEHSSIDAIMIGFPPYIKLSQKEAIAYVETIVSRFKREVLIYNNPGRTGFDLSVDSLEEIVQHHPNIVGIKEAGDTNKANDIKRRLGDAFQIFFGGEVGLLNGWQKGFNGLSSIIANIYPTEIVELVNELEQGRYNQAEAIYSFITTKNEQLMTGSFLPNLKYVMNRKGIPVGQCRPPLGIVEESFMKKVEMNIFF